jgi:CRISPR-associated protein Cas2
MVYDVREDRTAKVCKVARQYLTWIQNSVFEGEITNADLFKLKKQLNTIIDPNEDSVIFYILTLQTPPKKETIGKTKGEITQLF